MVKSLSAPNARGLRVRYTRDRWHVFTENTLEASTNGLVVFQGEHVISGNTIRSIPGTALHIGIFNDRVHDIEITGNDLVASGRGIDIVMSGVQPAPGNVAHQNNISGNTIGTRINAPGMVFDATCNWWGSPTGPNHPDNATGTGNPVIEIAGTVDYNPWLILPAPSDCPAAIVPGPHKATGGGRIEANDSDPSGLDLVLELAEVLIDNGSGPASVGRKATFGLSVRSDSEMGNLQYNDHDADVRIKATSITSLVVTEPSPACPTGRRGQIVGTAEQNGTDVDFTVHIDDCGEPGAQFPDRFQIETSAGYMAEGPLVGGNIKIQQE